MALKTLHPEKIAHGEQVKACFTVYLVSVIGLSGVQFRE